MTLSGGQRQRIAIARALLTDPRILILDDSTSAIDSATEDEIQKAIRRLLQGRTTLLITHRLSQIRWADSILVLKRGELIDCGTHEELLARCETYRRIFSHYEIALPAPTVEGDGLSIGEPVGEEERSTKVARKYNDNRRSEREMGFIMEGLDAEAYDRTYSDRQLVARIIGYFRPKARIMLIVAGLVVLTSLMDTVSPILISSGIDIVVASPALRTISLLVGAILLSGIISWLCNFLRQWLTARAVGDVVLRLRQDAFDAVMARDMSFFDEFQSGKIVTRVTSDTEDFATVVTLTLNLLSQVLLFFLIAGVIVVKSLHWPC